MPVSHVGRQLCMSVCPLSVDCHARGVACEVGASRGTHVQSIGLQRSASQDSTGTRVGSSHVGVERCAGPSHEGWAIGDCCHVGRCVMLDIVEILLPFGRSDGVDREGARGGGAPVPGVARGGPALAVVRHRKTAWLDKVSSDWAEWKRYITCSSCGSGGGVR